MSAAAARAIARAEADLIAEANALIHRGTATEILTPDAGQCGIRPVLTSYAGGAKRTVHVDDAGAFLLTSDSPVRVNGAGACVSVWHLLTPTENAPIPTRYTMKKKPAPKSAAAKKTAASAAERKHKAALAAKGKAAKPKPTAGSTMQRLADKRKAERAAAAPAKPVAKQPAPALVPTPVKATAPAAAGELVTATTPDAAGRKAAHGRIFGRYAYCSTSRALGIGNAKLGIAPFGTKEATAVFAALNPPVMPAKGSVSATLRDSRITPAALTEEDWKRFDALRVKAQRELGAKATADVIAKDGDRTIAARAAGKRAKRTA